jgi:hypothetical protein
VVSRLLYPFPVYILTCNKLIYVLIYFDVRTLDWNNVNASADTNRMGSKILRPTELGYYDLLDVDIRRRQGLLAKEYGVDGFIYHHYWFYHMFLGASLNAVVDKMLEDGHPDLPFALNWAQESWTNTWNGKHKYDSDIVKDPVVLIDQHYPKRNSFMIKEHYEYLRKFFHHKNYILVNGCPLFMVYGNSQRPEVIAIREKLRQLAMADGFPAPGLHIPATNAMVHHILYQNTSHHIDMNHMEALAKHNDAVQFYPYVSLPRRQMRTPIMCLSNISMMEILPKPTYLGVVTMYDNTPRRDQKSAKIGNRFYYPDRLGGPVQSFQNDLLEVLLYEKCCQFAEYRDMGGKFVLINAWNEWGEGMVLEPSNVYGRSLLEAVTNAKLSAANIGCKTRRLRQYRKKYEY